MPAQPQAPKGSECYTWLHACREGYLTAYHNGTLKAYLSTVQSKYFCHWHWSLGKDDNTNPALFDKEANNPCTNDKAYQLNKFNTIKQQKSVCLSRGHTFSQC